jgi:thioredoxin-related protein
MGCKKMDAVTYPNEAVTDFVGKHIVPVRLRYDQQPLAGQYRVKWTPTLIAVDKEGNEIYRNEGFLPPEDLIPALMLGIGKVRLNEGNYKEAISHFTELSSKYPKSEEAPEAVYFLGVARFKTTNDFKVLKQTFDKLSKQYPGSIWTKKASPYR